jgi:hypothetical protein
VATTGSDYFKLPSTSTEPSASTEIVRQVFHQPEGFNIWRDSIQPFIKDCMHTGLPEDDDELLHRDGGIHTKGDMARDLRDFLNYHRIRPAAEAHMMSLLEDQLAYRMHVFSQCKSFSQEDQRWKLQEHLEAVCVARIQGLSV